MSAPKMQTNKARLRESQKRFRRASVLRRITSRSIRFQETAAHSHWRPSVQHPCRTQFFSCKLEADFPRRRDFSGNCSRPIAASHCGDRVYFIVGFSEAISGRRQGTVRTSFVFAKTTKTIGPSGGLLGCRDRLPLGNQCIQFGFEPRQNVLITVSPQRFFPRFRLTKFGAHHKPRSASSVSPGPFTRQPITAIVMAYSLA